MEEEAEVTRNLGKGDDPELAESEGICFEEKRIDDTLMDTDEDKNKESAERSKRSEYRDEQIRLKERKRDEEEREYNKRKKENHTCV